MKPDFSTNRASDITTKMVGDAAVIELSGHIDEIAADVLSSQLDEVFEQNDPDQVIFDLSEVYYMGSSGLGQIMRAYRQTKDDDRSGCRVAVVNPQPLIRDLFRLTKLDKLLRMHPTVEDALNQGIS